MGHTRFLIGWAIPILNDTCLNINLVIKRKGIQEDDHTSCRKNYVLTNLDNIFSVLTLGKKVELVRMQYTGRRA